MKYKRSDLPELMWYRLLKVVFVISWGILLLVSLIVLVNGELGIATFLLIVFGFVLEIVRRSFFYVCTGVAAESDELEKMKHKGTKAMKGMGKVTAGIIAFLAFGLIVKAIPFVFALIAGFAIMNFGVDTSNSSWIYDLDAVANILALVLGALGAQKIYRKLTGSKATHKSLHLSK